MTFRLGLTGSIGMGKSATAAYFASLGYPVWDADATVHALYGRDGEGTRAIAAQFPEAIEDGAVSRAALRQLIAKDPAALSQIESLIHPLVAKSRARATEAAQQSGAALIVLDIPLLFETGADAELDGVAVVSTDAATQRERVLARPDMTQAQLDLILSRQMPDAEKRARARWVIPTDNFEGAHRAIRNIVTEITQNQPDAQA